MQSQRDAAHARYRSLMDALDLMNKADKGYKAEVDENFYNDVRNETFEQKFRIRRYLIKEAESASRAYANTF